MTATDLATCVNEDHDHRHLDENAPEPERTRGACNGCGQRMHYDGLIDDFVHDDPDAKPCFLIQSRPADATACVWQPTSEAVVAALVAVGVPAEDNPSHGVIYADVTAEGGTAYSVAVSTPEGVWSVGVADGGGEQVASRDAATDATAAQVASMVLTTLGTVGVRFARKEG